MTGFGREPLRVLPYMFQVLSTSEKKDFFGAKSYADGVGGPKASPEKA